MTTTYTRNAPDVYGAQEGAQLLGVTRARFYVLMSRDEAPKPRKLAVGQVWDGPALRAYKADREDQRAHGNRTRGTVLRTYRRTGVIAQAARAAGVDPSTARRWLQELELV